MCLKTLDRLKSLSSKDLLTIAERDSPGRIETLEFKKDRIRAIQVLLSRKNINNELLENLLQVKQTKYSFARLFVRLKKRDSLSPKNLFIFLAHRGVGEKTKEKAFHLFINHPDLTLTDLQEISGGAYYVPEAMIIAIQKTMIVRPDVSFDVLHNFACRGESQVATEAFKRMSNLFSVSGESLRWFATRGRTSELRDLAYDMLPMKTQRELLLS